MKQLQDLFEGFREIYSPNTLKQHARNCIDKGKFFRMQSGQYEWHYDNYILIFECSGTEYELFLLSKLDEEGELITWKGEAWDNGEHPDYVFSKIQDWDNIEVEIYLRDVVLK